MEPDILWPRVFDKVLVCVHHGERDFHVGVRASTYFPPCRDPCTAWQAGWSLHSTVSSILCDREWIAPAEVKNRTIAMDDEHLAPKGKWMRGETNEDPG